MPSVYSHLGEGQMKAERKGGKFSAYSTSEESVVPSMNGNQDSEMKQC